MFKKRTYIAFLLLIFPVLLMAQTEKFKLHGLVKETSGKIIGLAHIVAVEMNDGSITSATGQYNLELPKNKALTIICSSIGYHPDTLRISAHETKNISEYVHHITLQKKVSEIEQVVVTGDYRRESSVTSINPKLIEKLPNASGDFNTLLKTLPGVSGSNELSSQYSVRGGNFDENLVYVNDIEIHRPFLIRSGQQEGLSFINPEMVGSVLFSAGGFDAKYGDKMSSVLDIKYKKPVTSQASASASFMGASAHFEGTSKDRRFTHTTGIRYKSSRYLLNSLPTQGEYNPVFTDFQTYLTYDISPDFEIGFLGNFAKNSFYYVPDSVSVAFGSVQEVLNLRVFFEGQERDQFTTSLGALVGNYHPNKNVDLKFIVSAFNSREEETFDILGQYFLNELDKQLGSDNFTDSILNLGVGTYLDHARNKLNATVASAYHKGYYEKGNNILQWGAKYSHELINDQISEWMMYDSAGYSLPFNQDSVLLFEQLKSEINLSSNRYSSYIQDIYSLPIQSGEIIFNTGIRASYWDYNREWVFSPRGTISFKPNIRKDLLFRLAGGYYHQPPFYKELRTREGAIKPDVKSQESIHLVLGTDLIFEAWDRPFKFMTEVYYKWMNNLIPYEIDNLQIKYFPNELAKGYATGIDMKVNGEFVPGVESWASLSLMKTQEDILGDDQSYINRPTDQRMNFAIFFQDYIPNNDSYKANLNLVVGTGVPYGLPNNVNQKALFRMPAYRRLDLGFSKVLKKEDVNTNISFLNHFNNIWISLEVFNILDIKNTVSHVWISDIRNRYFPVPNYLTGRRLNLKLTARF